jgi:hypothetical protein
MRERSEIPKTASEKHQERFLVADIAPDAERLLGARGASGAHHLTKPFVAPPTKDETRR